MTSYHRAWRTSFVSLSLAFTTSLTAGDVRAQENQPQLFEETVVVASRIERPLRQVGSSVSVLTGEELQQMSYPSITEALRTLPSVRVRQNGGLGTTATVSIRGEEGHRTLLLIDGINVSDTSAPQIGPRFDQVLNSQWGRVEVLRGPQGMMYGADAGGVVSLLSKSSTEPLAGDLSAEYGEFDTRRLNGNVRGSVENLSYSVMAADVSSDGFNAQAADTTEDKDGYDNTTLHAKADLSLTEAFGIGMVARDVDSQSQFDGCGWPASYDCLADFGQQSTRLDAHYETSTQSHELAYASNKTDRVTHVVDQNSISFDSTGKVAQWQYLGYSAIAEDFSTVYGAEHRTDAFDNNLTGDSHERDQTGVFAEGQVSFGDSFFYTAGVRYDDNADFGDHTSYRLTAAYLVPMEEGELKLKGGYSTGFRAPSLYEIFYNARPDAPDFLPDSLTEETSKGYELGFEWLLAPQTSIEVVWFDSDIENEIYYSSDPETFSGGYVQSQGETESRGVEFIASVAVTGNLVLSGNYTYNKTALSDETTLAGAEGGDPRARRPKHAYNLSVEYSLWQDRVNLAAYYRSARDAVEYPWGGDGPAPLDEYHVLDVSGTWLISETLETYLRWENVLDEDYELLPGYNTSGSAGYLGLRVNF